MKKRIVLITTGGTIVSKNTNGKGAHPQLSGGDLINCIPNIKDTVEIKIDDFIKKPSISLELLDILFLVEKIKEYNRDPNIDGIVITHGTDTLEETAYMIDILVNNKKPIVITGAMRPADSVGSDGLANLEQAINVVKYKETRNYPPLVVMNNDIHLARLITKSHTSKLEAFRSVNTGPVGMIQEDRVIFFYRSKKRVDQIKEYIQKENNQSSNLLSLVEELDMTRIKDSIFKGEFPKVEIIKSYVAASDVFLKSAMENRLDALVIEGMGAGHIPPNWIPIIKKMLEKKILIAMVPRTFSGLPLYKTYGMVGAEIHLRNLGVLYSTTTSEKTRLFLLLALYQKITIQEIESFFKFL